MKSSTPLSVKSRWCICTVPVTWSPASKPSWKVAAYEAFDVTLTPNQAYGEYDENLVQEVPGELFDGMEVSEGDTFVAETDDGHRPVTVIEGVEEFIKVDGNHPWLA